MKRLRDTPTSSGRPSRRELGEPTQDGEVEVAGRRRAGGEEANAGIEHDLRRRDSRAGGAGETVEQGAAQPARAASASGPPSGAAISTTPAPCAAMSAIAGSPRRPLTSLMTRAPAASAAAATAARVVSAETGTETAPATTSTAQRHAPHFLVERDRGAAIRRRCLGADVDQIGAVVGGALCRVAQRRGVARAPSR